MTVQHPNGSKLSVCLHKVDRSSSELSNIKVAEVKGAAGLTLAASQPSPLETEKRSQDDRKSVKTVRPIAGLEPYVQLVNQQLKLLQLAANSSTTRRGCQPGSVLLHGPSGIGKSLILDKIAESSGERTTYRIGRQSPSRISSKLHDSIQDVFLKARNHECAIILIDELDEIAPEDALGAGRLEHLSVLCQSLEQVWRDRKRVICIATSRHVSRAHQSLRKPTGFETEIEIAPPDREARLRILLSLFPPTLGDKTKKLLQDISWKTHGYVGADLDLLVRRASQYELLATEESSGILPTENSETTDRGGQGISQSSLQKALVNTQPTAMREVLLEPPQVRWEDIGGQHEVKKKLKQAVEWPLRVTLLFLPRNSMSTR